MSLTDSVVIAIAIALAASPEVESLNTPMVAAYHTHYADRFREYSTAGGAGLVAMVGDGFLVTDAAYRAATVICSQSPAPANFAIGRRALPTQQSLTLTCLDALVGDAYALTVVGGTDGVAHALTYSVAPNLGASVTGTVAVVANSAAITFSGAQTMAAGDTLAFASQPGVLYQLSAAIVASTSGTLSTVYNGASAPTTTATHAAGLAGTFAVTKGSAAVPATSNLTASVSPGDSLMFGSQVGTYYKVLSVTATVVTLTSPYTGTTAASAVGADVATVGSAATAIGALINTLATLGTVTVAQNVITIARTDGLLNDIQGWRQNGFRNLALADTSADPGIATDLSAILAANTLSWYSLVLDSNSANELKAAAAAIEATGEGGKVFFTNTSDWANFQSSVTSDVLSQLQTLGYQKTHIQQNNSALLSYGGAGAAAYTGARNPGQYSMAQSMSLAGVPCDTEQSLSESEQLVINGYTALTPSQLGKGGNFYKVTAGLNCSFWSFTPGGRTMPLTIAIDWTVANMGADVFGLLAGTGKLPEDDFGLALIGDAIDSRIRIGGSASYGFVDLTEPVAVNVPRASALTSEQKAEGNAATFTWSFSYDSPILSAVINGTIIN